MRTSKTLRAQAERNRWEAESLLVKVRLLYVHSALEEAEANLLDEGVESPTPERIHMEAQGDRPEPVALIVRPEERKEGDYAYYMDIAKSQKRVVQFVDSDGKLTSSIYIPWHRLGAGYDLKESEKFGDPYF